MTRLAMLLASVKLGHSIPKTRESHQIQYKAGNPGLEALH